MTTSPINQPSIWRRTAGFVWKKTYDGLPKIAGYLQQTRCVQACVHRTKKCWTDHNAEFKYAIVAGTTAIFTSRSWLVTPLLMGAAAFAAAKGVKHSDAISLKIHHTTQAWQLRHHTPLQIFIEMSTAIATNDLETFNKLCLKIDVLTKRQRSDIIFSILTRHDIPNKTEFLSIPITREIDEGAISIALPHFVINNEINLIKNLLINNKLKKEHLIDALRFATMSQSSEEIFDVLLSKPIVAEITAESLKDSLIYTAQQGYVNAFHQLLSLSDFDPATLIELTNIIISSPLEPTKKIAIFIELLKKYSEIPQINKMAFNLAVSTGNEPLIDLLLLNNALQTLTPEHRSALTIAISTSRFSMLSLKLIVHLVKTADISPEAKSKSLPLLVEAITNQCTGIETLTTLLQTIPIGFINVDSDQKRAVISACQKGRKDIVDALLMRFVLKKASKQMLIDICHPSIKNEIAKLSCE